MRGRRLELLLIRGKLCGLRFRSCPEISHRLSGSDPLWNTYGKYRPLPVGAFHPDVSVHHRKELLRDRKPQPGSFYGTCSLEIYSFKFGKQLVLILFTDPDSRIFYRNNQGKRVALCMFFSNTHPDTSFLRILQSIAQKIVQDLSDSYLIAVKTGGNILLCLADKFQSLFLCLQVYHIADVIQYNARLIFPF